jgi:hypothetical protein
MNACPQPCGSDPHARHWETKSTSIDEVSPVSKLTSTWQMPAALLMMAMLLEPGSTAHWLASGMDPFSTTGEHTEQGPVVDTTGG